MPSGQQSFPVTKQTQNRTIVNGGSVMIKNIITSSTHKSGKQRRRVPCICLNCQNGNKNDSMDGGGPKKREHNCHIADCKKAYSYPSNLKKHLLGHTRDKLDLHCPLMHCTKRYKKAKNLIRHMETHTEGKKYCCPDCDEKFIRADELLKHIKKHHAKKLMGSVVHTEEKPFHCSKCNKKFWRSRHLSEHLKKHSVKENGTPSTRKKSIRSDHPSKLIETLTAKKNATSSTSESKSRRRLACACPNCLEGGINVSSDRNYSLGGGGPKKRLHICHIPGCIKAYGDPSRLERHLLWHTGGKPFTSRCMHCPKRFTSTDDLSQHDHLNKSENKFRFPDVDKKLISSDSQLSKFLDMIHD